MFYPETLIEEIREKNDIVDVISEYVALKRSGKQYFGLCPFHNEKSPSFSVDPTTQLYNCFGCHKAGNVFTFMGEYFSMTFPEAVESLGERAGVKLPEKTYSAEAKRNTDRKQKLFDINKDAANYFYSLLRHEPGAAGLKYFEERQLSEETMKKFALGFAANHNSDLVQYLKNKGYTDDIIKDSGLAVFNEQYGFRDKFINRVMFPILNPSGKVIGFGGRVMEDGKVNAAGIKVAKYLNSPETDIFDKSRNLFGLNFARTTRKGYLILCEGYMDVIAMHQAGFIEAVASLGTAFTQGQAMLIKRYVHSLYFAYDSDDAGVNAAVRAIEILRDVGIDGKVINMSPYKDPDEFIKNLGADEFQKRIDNAENGFIFEIRTLKRGFDLEDPSQKTRFHKEIIAKLLQFEEMDERENYLEAVCRAFDINFENLKSLMISEASKGSALKKRKALLSGIQNRTEDERVKAEDVEKKPQRVLLTWLVENPALYEKVKEYISPEDFTDELYKSVAEYLFADIEAGVMNPAAIINRYQDVEQQAKAAALFNTKLDAIENEEERKIAFKEIVLSVKKNSFDYFYSMTGSDRTALAKVIEIKRVITEISNKNYL